MTSSAGAGVIVKPKPQQKLGSHPVSLTVKAGPEHGDLRAWLNGKEIGEHFQRQSKARRTLNASPAYGLRRGRNVLRVVSRIGLDVKHQKVSFKVVHRRPIVSAGRDRRTTAGVRLKLTGTVRNHARGPKAGNFRWKIVSAPKQSRFGPKQPGITRPKKLAATFRPDEKGQYVFELAGRSSKTLSRDRMILDAVPAAGLVPVDTELDGSVFGVQVGQDRYLAPPMYSGNGKNLFSGSSAKWSHFASLWQMVVIDRKTLAGTGWNVTYGLCTAPGGSSGICQKGDNGEPFLVIDPKGKARDGSSTALYNRILSFGPTRLVIAANHYDGNNQWGLYDASSIATKAMSAAGFPSVLPLGDTAGKSAALVGVPGMKPGTANYVITPGPQRMEGYLSPDPLYHFGYMPRAREGFDTRESSECGVPSNGKCTVTQTIAGQAFSGTLNEGEAGYLVTSIDGYRLNQPQSRLFVTFDPAAAGNSRQAAEDMGDFLRARNEGGNSITITSVHTPGTSILAHPSIDAPTWKKLATAVALTGGTQNRFNRTASEAGQDYTLVGWDKASEGEGSETRGASARLRGSLIPGNDSMFRPSGANGGGESPERLQQLVLETPTVWTPMPGGSQKAAAAIGNKVGLSSNPRAAYPELTAPEDAQLKYDRVDSTTMSQVGGASPAFTRADFDAAKSQLKAELLLVENTRVYLKKLAAPAAAVKQSAWEDASKLADQLEVELKVYDEEAELSFDAFGTIVSLLGFAAEGIGEGEAQELVMVLLNATIAAQVAFDADYDGSSEIDNDPRIKADQLADALEQRAEANLLGFERMGDVIVSDPAKLAEVGTYANCTTPCGTKTVNGETIDLDEYSTDQMQSAAAVSSRALERTIYTQLVPLSFPVWDTGKTALVKTERFTCYWNYSPFSDAPARAWVPSLVDFDPTGNQSESRVYIMTHRRYLTYSWPQQEILNRMFDPVSEGDNPESGGLAIDPVDLMRDSQPRFVPSGEMCGWLHTN